MSNQRKIKPTIRPTIKQDLCWDKLRDNKTIFIGFGGGAGGGKTWIGCEWFLTNCYFYPNSRWFIGRKELKRLINSTYVTWCKVCKYHQIPQEDWSLDGKYNYIQFKNGSRIDLLDLDFLPSDPLFERFGSLEYTGGWIEEAGEVQFGAFDILKTRIGRHLNDVYNLLPKLLLTFNPNKGWLYRLFYKPWKAQTLPLEYAFIQSLYQDNPYTKEIYGKMLDQITEPVTKQRLKYGLWEYDDNPDSLVNYNAIIDLFTNTVEKSEEKYLVADIARFGQDKTVITLWQGLICYCILVYTKQTTEKIAGIIKQLAIEAQIPYSHILIDEDGIGGGVVDQLFGCQGFVANSRPLLNVLTGEIENFNNLKSQCGYKLAEKINRHELSVKCKDEIVKEHLIQELEYIRAKDIDKDGKRQLMPKEMIKDLLGRSPDYSDCFLMRMYFELDNPGGKIWTAPSTQRNLHAAV